ncbi:MAG: hypothetical protein QM589_18180 [Thermomicrobiales bacterium]
MNVVANRFAFRRMALAGAIALSLGVGTLGNVAFTQTAATPEAGVEVPPDLPPRIGTTSAEPLSVNDCTAPERSRDEVLTILQTPPTTNPPGQPPDWSAPEIHPGAGFGNGMGTMSDAEFDSVEAVFRQWQVCHLLGKTWNQMSLETDQVIREDVYGDTRIMTAYSDAALAEVLDARAEADAASGEQMHGPGRIASVSPMAIDRDGNTATSADGDYMIVEVVDVFEDNGEQVVNPAGTVSFWKIGGVWLIDRVDLLDR